MGKSISAVTRNMSLYSTRPNVRLGTSQSLQKSWFLNRALVVTNRTPYDTQILTSNKSTSLMKNGFVNKVGNYQNVKSISVKTLTRAS